MTETAYGQSILRMDDQHKYTLDDRPLISNTALLAAMGVVDTSRYTPESAARGTAVHLETQRYDEGATDTDWFAYPEYTLGWAAFRRESRFQPRLIETPVYHSAGYATTLDRVGTLNGVMVVLEIKTGTTPKWVGLQLAGQSMAVCERIKAGHMDRSLVPYKRFCLTLPGNGRYSLTEYDGAGDAAKFLTLLSAWQVVKEYRDSFSNRLHFTSGVEDETVVSDG